MPSHYGSKPNSPKSAKPRRMQLNAQEAQDISQAMQSHLLSEKRAGRPLDRKRVAELRRKMENSVARRRKSK